VTAGLLLSLTLLSTGAEGDVLDRIRERGYFSWGADQEGGGPYVFPDPADSSRILGFELELAGLIATELGAELGRPMEARFFQGPWDRLPDLLDTDRIDMVLNGYEWTVERAQRMDATIPYYIYELQLLTRRNDERFAGIDSIFGKGSFRVGILGGSAAERSLLRRNGAAGVEIVNYDGNTNAMQDVASGRLDATVQDLPIAVFYSKEFPSLRRCGDPFDPGQYVIYVKRGQTRLLSSLDGIISRLRSSGRLRKLYESYGIWTAAQEDPRLLSRGRPIVEAPTGGIRRFFVQHGVIFLQAAGMTILLSVVSMPIAMALGLLVALGRLHGPRILSIALTVYVEILRGTPLMLQLLVIFYLLPFRMEAIPAAVLGLSVNYSAYESEIYRAGLQAIPATQMEAALALGMSKWVALWRIIIPQAVRIVIPPVTNDFIALFKDTSVCSVITVVELTKRYNIAVMNHPDEILALAAVAGALYLAMSYPMSLFASAMERRLER
jgi:polar amino acid transport system substrate-binding protein